jgi:hypothetical protein
VSGGKGNNTLTRSTKNQICQKDITGIFIISNLYYRVLYLCVMYGTSPVGGRELSHRDMVQYLSRRKGLSKRVGGIAEVGR